jgi:hypothetical protein
LVRALGDGGGQRRLVVLLDMAADDGIEQTTERALLRVAGGELGEFELKGFEGPQTWVLGCEPSVKSAGFAGAGCGRERSVRSAGAAPAAQRC